MATTTNNDDNEIIEPEVKVHDAPSDPDADMDIDW
jgi:hypothetical protein